MEVEQDSARHRHERTSGMMCCCCPQRPSKQTSKPADSDVFDNGEEISVQKMPYETKFGVRVTKNAPTYRHATNRMFGCTPMRPPHAASTVVAYPVVLLHSVFLTRAYTYGVRCAYRAQAPVRQLGVAIAEATT